LIKHTTEKSWDENLTCMLNPTWSRCRGTSGGSGGYGAIALMLIIGALIVAPGDEQQAAMFGPMLIRMKVKFGYGFSIAASLSFAWSTGSLGCRLYFGL
jgi:hypothetical protein